MHIFIYMLLSTSGRVQACESQGLELPVGQTRRQRDEAGAEADLQSQVTGKNVTPTLLQVSYMLTNGMMVNLEAKVRNSAWWSNLKNIFQ